jgi:hypothetical protein
MIQIPASFLAGTETVDPLYSSNIISTLFYKLMIGLNFCFVSAFLVCVA